MTQQQLLEAYMEGANLWQLRLVGTQALECMSDCYDVLC